MGHFVTLKKIRSKIWSAKSRVQKAGSLLFKKRRGQVGLINYISGCRLIGRMCDVTLTEFNGEINIGLLNFIFYVDSKKSICL